MDKVSFKPNAKMAFVQMGNVEAFNKGAESLGVPASALFQVGLYCYSVLVITGTIVVA